MAITLESFRLKFGTKSIPSNQPPVELVPPEKKDYTPPRVECRTRQEGEILTTEWWQGNHRISIASKKIEAKLAFAPEPVQGPELPPQLRPGDFRGFNRVLRLLQAIFPR